MLWFIIALTGYLLLAVVFILDKFIVTKSARPVVYAFYSTIFMFGALLLLPFFGWGILRGFDWGWAAVSGVAFGLGLWTFYVAVKKGEATHISPFNGAMITVFIYLLASVFLGERLTGLQIGGMLILFFACIPLSFEKSRAHNGFHLGFVWAIVSGLFFAVSHVSAKYLYGVYPFWTAFIWTRAMTGFLGLLLLFSPTVWKSFKRSPEAQPIKSKHTGAIIVTNKVLSVLSNSLIQYAIALGSVTLVNALAGLQYVFMFIFIYLLTRFLPKVFKEYFTKREIVVEIIAIVLVVIGSVFFVL